jgi:transcriptional regulator with XRE-family HTH domain
MDINAIINNSPDAILQKVAARVKEKRLEHNFTQKSFAKRAGIGSNGFHTTTANNNGEPTVDDR